MSTNSNTTGALMGRGRPTQALTQVEFSEADFPIAEKIAKRLGFTQTAYTSTSALWGLFCLPDRAGQRHGCVIKTRELGFLFVADLEDMQMEDLRRASAGQVEAYTNNADYYPQ